MFGFSSSNIFLSIYIREISKSRLLFINQIVIIVLCSTHVVSFNSMRLGLRQTNFAVLLHVFSSTAYF
jgi:hypothetical protein